MGSFFSNVKFVRTGHLNYNKLPRTFQQRYFLVTTSKTAETQEFLLSFTNQLLNDISNIEIQNKIQVLTLNSLLSS